MRLRFVAHSIRFGRGTLATRVGFGRRSFCSLFVDVSIKFTEHAMKPASFCLSAPKRYFQYAVGCRKALKFFPNQEPLA